MLLVLASNSIYGLLLDAVVIGIVYARFSRGKERSLTVIFSSKAVVREVNGSLYLMFQV